jgi:tetratricopeptide (TPR) repeat protein
MIKYEAQLFQEYELSDFKVRVGINSGYVVAGHVAGAEGEYTVIGDTVNLASRFEEAAPPGEILVGENTFRLAGERDQFEVEPWGEMEVKGEPRPLSVYQILSRRPQGQSRKAAVARAPLAGREPEMKVLKDHFKEGVSRSQGQVVLVEGEAGIGKSRLRHEFVAWLDQNQSAVQVWLGRAFSYTRQTPYALASSMLKSALSILETDNVDQRRKKLDQGLSGMPVEQLHGLAAILALPYPDDSLSGLEPQARRHAIFEAFKTFCFSHAEQNQLVLIFEDVHWADDISLDLIESLVEEDHEVAFYCLLLTRPDTRTGFRYADLEGRMNAESYTTIQLDYLTHYQSGDMIRSLLPSSNVSEDIIQPILSVTQGNPFFIEEIISSFKEDGTLEPMNGGWQLARSLEGIQVPDTVQGVLAARIDRLEPDLKITLQQAAIIGRTFWQELLNNLVTKNVDSQLSKLSEQEFVERQGRAMLVQDWEWIFRHALVQEVAYDSVLKEVRREVHRNIAQWLERHGADRIEELAPAIGLHYEQGQTWDKAVGYLVKAADRSKEIFALREAASFLDRAVRLTEDNPNAVDRRTLLSTLEKRGEVRGLAGEFAGAIEDLNMVLDAARQEADKPRERDLLISLGRFYLKSDDYENAVTYLSQSLDTARGIGDRHGMADVLYHLGLVYWSQGDNLKATPYYEEAIQISRQLGLMDMVAVQALHGRGEAYGFSGQPKKAIELFNESLEIARQIGDKSYESENLQMIGMMHDGRYGDAEYDLAIDYASESLKISQEAHLHWHMVNALFTLGANLLGVGDFQGAIDQLTRAIDQARIIGAHTSISIGLGNLGNCYQALNLLKRAEKVHSKGLELEGKIGTNFYLPRLKAELAIDRLRLGILRVGPDLNGALEEARARDQVAHAIRCLEGLAELSHVRGDHETAYRRAAELLQIAQAGDLGEIVAKAYMWQGKAKLAGGSPEAAEDVLQQAVQLADMIGAPRLRWDVHAALAEVYKVQGKQKQAAHCRIFEL